MVADLPTYPFIVIASLVGVLGGFSVQRYIARRNARQIFRERLIELLRDFYPPSPEWHIGFEVRLSEQLQNLGIEVNKFRFHVPRRQRLQFDTDWDALLQHARSMSWDSCAGYSMYPSMRKPEDRDPKVVFYEHLDRLLNYAR